MKNEKLFEVILSPAEMLENELEEVLGGICTFECGKYEGTGDFDQTKCSFSCTEYKKFSCPPGYTWSTKQCKCVPIP